MGEEGKEDIVTNVEYCPGKLNFNAPLLTTRRPVGMKALEMPRARARSLHFSKDFTTSSPVRIPFSWEQTPGKPKNVGNNIDVRNNNINVDLNNFLPPPPKLPPCRWIPEAAAEANDDEGGFDGDVEDYCNNEEDDDQSDTIDVFSLGQSVEEVVEPGDGLVEMFGFEGLIERDRGGGGYHSPNFIIQRFLPDAKALAANSSSATNTLLDDQPSGGGGGLSREISVRRRTYPTTTTKGCGLDNFFPWKMKPKPCGTKNPVVFAAPLRDNKTRQVQLMHHQKRKVVQENLP